MFYLLLSILLNTYIGIAFVYFKKYKVDIFQAIVFNYSACVITGSLVISQFPINSATIHGAWFPWAIAMGALFISLFNIIAFSSVKVGVTITQTSNKLSLAIPVLFAWLYYHEQISLLKLIGILFAILSVLFITSKKNTPTIGNGLPTRNSTFSWEILLPITLFIGSGILDTMTKYVQCTFLVTDKISNDYLISGFFVAAFIGSLVLAYFYLTKKKTFHIRHLIAGILLGIPNYFSIYYLIKALKSPELSSSATIPINNIAVLFVVSLFGIFIFREKLSTRNYWGLVLSLIAITLIFFGDKL